jgi:peroxiredoxin
VTSQSPAEAGDAPDEYKQAWASIQHMVMNEGASWSGREANRLFLNLGELRFADVSSVGTVDFKGDGRALAVLDWDDDGRQDLVLKSRTAPRLRVLRNEIQNPGNFINVQLVGVTSNHDAIGARVILQAGGKTFRKTLYGGEGYLAQSSKRLHFGIGEAKTVQKLTVLWPDGTTDSFENIPAGSRLGIVQGEDLPFILPERRAPRFASAESKTLHPEGGTVRRVPLGEKIPLSPWGIPPWKGKANRKVENLSGGPVLLNIWSTTCRACLLELEDFKENQARIKKSGLRIVPLCADEADSLERAKSYLEEFGLLSDAGWADDQFKSSLKALLDVLLGPNSGSPLPTSLLLDSKGQLVAIYPGPVEMSRLLQDVSLLKEMDSGNLLDSLLLGGKRIIRKPRNWNGLADGFRDAGLKRLEDYYRRLSQ